MKLRTRLLLLFLLGSSVCFGQGRRIQDLPNLNSNEIDAVSNVLLGTSKLDGVTVPAQSYKLSVAEFLELLPAVENVKRHGAVGDGVTDDRAAILAAATAAAVNGGTVYFPPISASYLVNTDLDIPTNVSVRVDRDALIKVTSGQTLTIYGGVRAGEYQIFDADVGDVLIYHKPGTATLSYPWLSIYQEQDGALNPRQRTTTHNDRFCALWFKGDDIGRKCNAALAAGGNSVRVYIPPGNYSLSETVNMAEEKNGGGGYGDNVIVEGAGFLATNIYIQSDDVIGFDMQRGDEAVVRRMRILREPGNGKTAVGVRVGGTTCIATELWIGPLEYGIVCNAASRAIVGPHVTVEHCQYGLALLSGFEDESVGLDSGTNVRQSAFNIQAYECDTYGVWIERAELVAVSGVTGGTGTFNVGETVSITGGKTAEVLRWNPTYGTLSLRFTGTAFGAVVSAGNTITGDTTMTQCTADSNGVSGQSRGLQFDDCLFHVNGVSNVGSGAYVRGYIQNLTFTGGHSYGEEGAYGFEIYNCEGLNITGWQFEGDAATAHIRVENGDASISSCGFIGTLTPTAIDITNADVTVVGSKFDSDITTPLSYDISSNGSVQAVGNIGLADIRTPILLTVDDATPSVRGISFARTANTVGTAYTTFDDGVDGQLITIRIKDVNTSLTEGATIDLGGGGNFAPAGNAVISLWLDGTVWREVSRQVGTIEEIGTGFTDGRIPYPSGGKLIESNGTLFWNNGTSRFGVGAGTSPGARVHAKSGNATTVAMIAEAAASASVDIMRIQTSAGVVSKFDQDGVLTTPYIKRGNGSPEGAVTANVGAIYTRLDGGAGTTLYVKESGTGNTGWVGK